MPKNTYIPICAGGFSLILGFGITWHMYWLALIGIVGIFACVITRLCERDAHDVITAQEVEKIEASNRERYA